MPSQLPGDDELASLARAFLAEDLGAGDITSNAIIPEDAKLRAVIAARERLVLAGVPLARAICAEASTEISFLAEAKDGDELVEGSFIALLAGPARAILAAERTALNALQHLSGIATLTRQYVRQIEGSGAVLLDTRKTTPGLRSLEKYATHLGGAQNHRMGLFDAVLIKDNHIALMPDGNRHGVAAAVAQAREVAGGPIEVECDTLDQVREAIEAAADMILLDNMTPDEMTQAVAMVRDHTKDGAIALEASGGVTLDTIRAIAETGVDFISVGRLTQSAEAVDIGLDYAG